MRTTTRAMLGLFLLAALLGTLRLFAIGRITFSSSPRGPAIDPPRAFTASWDGIALPASARRTGPWIAPPGADACNRFVSEDHGHALILSACPSVFDGVPVARPSFILLRADGPTATPWSRSTAPRDAEGEVHVPMETLVGPGDTALARGHLPFDSGRIHVLDEGGFVVVDYAGTDSELLLRYDAAGQLAWSRSCSSVFGEAWLREFPTTWSHGFDAALPWQNGTWVDEQRHGLVIVSWEDRVLLLSLVDGSTVPDVDEVGITLDHFTRGDPSERVDAVELARRRAWPQAAGPARALVGDASASEGARLHAALLLADRGDLPGRDVVLGVTQRAPGADAAATRDVELAWRQLGRFLGEQALPLYVGRLRVPMSNAHVGTIEGEVAGLAALGEPAIEPALMLVLEVPRDPSFAWHLPHLLARLRDEMKRGDRHSTRSLWPCDQELPVWDSLIGSGDPHALQELLALQNGMERKDHWSVLVLPALRWAALHPRPEFAEPLRAFRPAFAAHPECRDAWRDRVLAEVDVALAVCGAH